jgi:TPR repeat protein
MFNLGVLLAARGDTTQAERWYRQAANADDPEAGFQPGHPAG